MSGISKRPAQFVPEEYRAKLDQLSKADLMELTWSFAVWLVGEDKGDEAAFEQIKDERAILDENLGVRTKKLA